METRNDPTPGMEAALGAFSVEDIRDWLACSNEAATAIWTSAGLLQFFVEECERSVQKRVKPDLQSQFRDDVRGAGAEVAMRIYREIKPDDNAPSKKQLQLQSADDFLRYLRRTMRFRALDVARASVPPHALLGEQNEGVPAIRVEAVEQEDLERMESQDGEAVIGQGEEEMVRLYARRELADRIPGVIAKFAGRMEKTRAKQPRRLLQVILELFRDDPVMAGLVLLGEESPPELRQAFCAAVGEELNDNTYYSHVRRLRTYFWEFLDEGGEDLFRGGSGS